MTPLNHQKMMDYFAFDNGAFTIYLRLYDGTLIKARLNSTISIEGIVLRQILSADELVEFLVGIDATMTVADGDVSINDITDTLTMEHFITEICSVTMVDRDTLFKQTKWRKHEYVLARQMLMMVRRQALGMSLRMAGEIFNKDHASVYHGIKTVNNQRDTDKAFKRRTDRLIEMIANFTALNPIENLC